MTDSGRERKRRHIQRVKELRQRYRDLYTTGGEQDLVTDGGTSSSGNGRCGKCQTRLEKRFDRDSGRCVVGLVCPTCGEVSTP